MKNKTFFLIFFLTIVNYCFAQKISYQFAFGDRKVTIYPFTHDFYNKVYPVVQTGIEYQYFEKNKFSLSQTLLLHYNYHPFLGYGFGIFSEAAASYKFKKPFFFQFNLGLGYLGELPTDKTYSLNSSGEFIEVRPLHSMASTSFSLLFGYEILNGFSIFTSYQYAIQLPYNKSVVLLPTGNILLGVKLKFIKNGKHEE